MNEHGELVNTFIEYTYLLQPVLYPDLLNSLVK